LSQCEQIEIEIEARATLPTQYGDFKIYGFTDPRDQKEHVALVCGQIEGTDNVLLRIHSECLTGDAFHSLRCDCNSQLKIAMQTIQENGSGMVLYLRQEGRGIGLINKLKAYTIQDEQGLNTLEANEALGFKDDERDYDIVAAFLKKLAISSVHLLTNNPEKIENLEKCGIAVPKRIPVISDTNDHNKDYIETKRQAGHLFS